MKTIKKILPILTIAAVFGALYIASVSIPQEKVRQLLTSYGPTGPLVFIFLMLATHIFSPISSSPFLFAGFYAFGENVVLLMTAASILAAITNFWIARVWGRGFVARLVGQGNVNKIDKFTKNYGLWTIFFLRVFLGGLHDFISYAAGLTRIRFVPYFLISVAGTVPGTLVWYMIARKIESPVNFTIITILMVVGFSAVFGLGTFLFRKLKK